MVNLGRPVSLNRENVSEACMHAYWSRGITNISYNDVIKSSKLSKGSIYKLFNNEDDLQAETLNYYIKNDNLIFKQIASDAEDLFQLMQMMNDYKFSNNMKYCYFMISYTERYKVGKKTRANINKIANNVKKILNDIVKKHIKKHSLKKNNVQLIKLVNYIFNTLTLIMVMERNKASESEINMHKETLFKLIKNISYNKKYFIFN